MLVSEHADLAKKDIEASMDQDPAVAGTLMKPERLAEIERFLFVEGEIRFRCPEIKLAVPNPPEPEPESSKTAESKVPEPEKPSGPPVPLPRRKPAPPTNRAG